MNSPRTPLRPDRLRVVERPFGWLPCRMLNNGTIARMSPIERQLYLVLALAADRRGISFHSDRRIEGTLGCSHGELHRARSALVARDLLAYDGDTYQLLPLPPEETAVIRPSDASTPSPPLPTSGPSPSISRHQQDPHGMPESVREALRQLFGRESF